ASSVRLEAGSVGAADFAVRLSASANVTGTTGVQLVGDNIDLATGATVNADIAYLYGSTFGTTIALGGADDGISANALRIGDPSSGTISFVSQIAPAGVNQLELHTAADIQDNHAGIDVTVARLTMNAFSGIGVTGTSGGIDTDVALIEAQTGFGG